MDPFVQGKWMVQQIAEDGEDYLYQRPYLQLNRLVKELLLLSNRGVMDIINYYYRESFGHLDFLDWSCTEEVTGKIGELKAHLFLKAPLPYNHFFYFRLETCYHEGVGFSILHYVLEKAKESLLLETPVDTYQIPLPLLILLEGSLETPPQLSFTFGYPLTPSKGEFLIPILRLFTYTPYQLFQKKLYLLLPLSILSFRTKMDIINKREIREDLRELWRECKGDFLEKTSHLLYWMDRSYKERKLNHQQMVTSYRILGQILNGLCIGYPQLMSIQQDLNQMLEVYLFPLLEG